jgi:ABC-type polysaccharide/polyol phosphate export permease
VVCYTASAGRSGREQNETAANRQGLVVIDNSLREILVTPFRLLVVHRSTIEALVRRDIRARYVSSVMGLSWAVIQPLALLGLYTFIFSYVLRLRLGGSDSTGTFALYLLCGMLPWLAFAEGLTRSASVILEQAHLIKKVVFPSEILPPYVVVTALAIELVGLGVLLAAVAVFRGGVGWPLLLLPVVILLQFLFTVGLGWVLASVNVFLRDVGQVLALGLTLWMFVTPIFYPAELMPARFRWVLDVNPMYYVVEAYRAVVMDQRLPDLSHAAVLAAMALVAFVAGHWVFRRSKHAFVDVL